MGAIMKTGSAVIIALGLTIGGFLAGGRYAVVASTGNSIARLDRYTGAVEMCVVGAAVSCGWTLDHPTAVGSGTRPPTLTDDQMRALEKAGLATAAQNSN